MTLMPFQVGDPVLWRGYDGRVVEIRSDRVVVQYERGDEKFVAIISDRVLRAQQNGVMQDEAVPPWPSVG